MRPVFVALATVGCATQASYYQAPPGATATAKVSVRAEHVDYYRQHTKSWIKSEDGKWKRLKRGRIDLVPGTHTLYFDAERTTRRRRRFGGQSWLDTGNVAVDVVGNLVGVAFWLAETDARQKQDTRKRGRCISKIVIDVHADEELEIVFRHFEDGTCGTSCLRTEDGTTNRCGPSLSSDDS